MQKTGKNTAFASLKLEQQTQNCDQCMSFIELSLHSKIFFLQKSIGNNSRWRSYLIYIVSYKSLHVSKLDLPFPSHMALIRAK